MEFIYRPIVQWPGRLNTSRKRATFRAGYNNTLSLLDTELRHLKARQIVLQVAMTEEDIRLDGRPRANSRPAHPGIILSFESKHGPLAYPCDTFDSWEDNLRAIALALENLRAVDRYGVTKRGEQYTGWQQLPAPSADNGIKTTHDALVILADAIKRKETVSVGNWKEIYRQAALATHPDRGGDSAAFQRVQAAAEFLEKSQK